MSYPRFWDFTRKKPADSDLLGIYKVIKVRLDSDLRDTVRKKAPALILNVDHKALFANFPVFHDVGDTVECTLAGSATWSSESNLGSGLGWGLRFDHYHPSTPSSFCGYKNGTWSLDLLGQKPPIAFT